MSELRTEAARLGAALEAAIDAALARENEAEQTRKRPSASRRGPHAKARQSPGVDDRLKPLRRPLRRLRAPQYRFDCPAPVSLDQLGLFYSAGVDSALLAKLCQDLGLAPRLLCLGTRYSKDRRAVERSRSHLDLPIEFVTVTKGDIAQALPIVERRLEEAGVFTDHAKLNQIHSTLGVGTYLACRAAHQRDIRWVLTAHGADALFAGFDRYRRMSRPTLPATLEQDVESAIDTGLVRDQVVADAFEIEILAPFLAPDVVTLGLEIPLALKLGPRGNKLVLRELARQRGLPRFIVRRPKKSMQYSTGISRIVREIERGE
jgi:asparagine synthase (glutamine-hydrolysing)